MALLLEQKQELAALFRLGDDSAASSFSQWLSPATVECDKNRRCETKQNFAARIIKTQEKGKCLSSSSCHSTAVCNLFEN